MVDCLMAINSCYSVFFFFFFEFWFLEKKVEDSLHSHRQQYIFTFTVVPQNHLGNLCNVITSLLSCRNGVHFPIPGISTGLVVCFGRYYEVEVIYVTLKAML